VVPRWLDLTSHGEESMFLHTAIGYGTVAIEDVSALSSNICSLSPRS
jgi:hypothetical protein